jgi:deazaflavin-dependent oxidoreductase (nitroreductase family)
VTSAPDGHAQVPAGWATEEFGYLTTVGRRSGRRHEIEIWFAVHDGRLYLISGGGERSDWVRNLRAEDGVEFRVGDDTRPVRARALAAGDHPARALLAGKYQGWRPGRPLSGWATRGLLVELSVLPSTD